MSSSLEFPWYANAISGKYTHFCSYIATSVKRHSEYSLGNQTFGKNKKEGLGDIGWGGSVPCARDAGVLLIGSQLHSHVRLMELLTATHSRRGTYWQEELLEHR